MSIVVSLPSGQIVHLKTGATIEALPSGVLLNEVASGSGAQSLFPSLYSNSQTFYSPVVSIAGGLQTVFPPLISDTNVFYSATVSIVGTQNTFPSLFTNSSTFYAATVTRVPGFLTPVLKNNTGTVLASQTGVICNVYNATTGALVLHKTGLTSDVNGVVSVTDVTMVGGTTYTYEIVLSGARRLPTAVA